MPDFSKRSSEEEIMDDLHASGPIIDSTLSELETINLLLGGNYVTVNGVSKLLSGHVNGKPISIVDVGCGSGDILRLIQKFCTKKKISVALTGVDANPNIVLYAALHTDPTLKIQYKALNIFSSEFQSEKFDILTATLFFHHFTDEQLITFFKTMKEKLSIGIVINDIHRHWFAYYSIKWLTKMFSKSYMVRNDAPVSVMRAFRKQELISILERAGIKKYSIRWMWAFRWQVIVDLTVN
jgi:2-polyprenyl-3-methyl-5-hydroxy-6-metoxy-1,4-benzoquinol methylase